LKKRVFIVAEKFKNVYNIFMQQKNVTNKAHILSTIVASVCIVVYLTALVFAAIRLYVSIDERRIVAEQEFYDLADLASSAGVLGFMDDPFIQTINDALAVTVTLQALIISGPNGEYAFEKERGAVIDWVNNSPRFKSRFDLSREPLYMPLRIDGLRNVNIQAAASSLDYGLFAGILKQTLIMVLAALTLAFFTLLLQSLTGRTTSAYSAPPRTKNRIQETGTEPVQDDFSPFTGTEEETSGDYDGEASTPASAEKTPTGPTGLFSPHGNIGWEEYVKDRLASELHRCASFEQDLVFIVMEFKDTGKLEDSFYNQFADDAVNFFTLRDLIFERGERGISIIYPNIDLDMGFAKSEEFHNRILSKYSNRFTSKTDLCIGLSSRSGRLIDGERLIFEAEEALQKALDDPVSHIVAFKSDPEKYREFIRKQNNL
jgi:hypothetical protein